MPSFLLEVEMKEKIKILHVQLTGNFGGIESLLTNVYEKIDRNKFQFDFIATEKEPYQRKLEDLGAKVYVMPSMKHFVRYLRKFNSILNSNYDVVHFHKNSAANIVPILFAKFHSSHPKIIVHSHNTSPSFNNKGLIILHKFNRIFLNKILNKRVACSNSAAKWMFGTLTNVQIINNGIDVDKFTFSTADRSAIRKKYHIRRDDYLLGTVGRLTKQKNHKMTINIFNEIKKTYPNVKLMIIGDGYLKENITKQVLNLGIENDVIFLGVQLEVNKYLSAMDAFIMPSLYEGLGIAAIEAQSEGLPTYISENFPNEVNLTTLIHSFSLSEKPQDIAQMIINNSHKKSIRNANDSMKVRNSNYSLESTVKSFTKLYQGILK